jgi:hypothetical protein
MKRALLLLPMGLAACTSAPPPPPAVKAPAPPPPHVAVPALPTRVADWRDRPYSPGVWHYADKVAAFGVAGAPPLLTMRCDAAGRIVLLTIAGSSANLTIRTSYAERTWPAQPTPDGRTAVRFAATDPALDQIAFSRGRFSVSAPGMAEIDIPAWAEPSRVIEDCRG